MSSDDEYWKKRRKELREEIEDLKAESEHYERQIKEHDEYWKKEIEEYEKLSTSDKLQYWRDKGKDVDI